MTVNILIQIDKLVQLIESPVFTCEFLLPLRMPHTPANGSRPPFTAAGAGKVSPSVQMPLRPPHAFTAVFRLRRLEESVE